MFYLESPAGRMLMAGNQTELRAIEKVWIDTLNRRVFVLQKDELLTFDLDFIGNVAPLKFAKSNRLILVKSLRFLPSEKQFELTLTDGTVINMNSDAESRNRSSRKPATFGKLD